MKTVRLEGKGKGSAKVSSALDELQFLMDFNVSITQAAAKTMEHLSEFVFISMGNLTLARRDSYLNHIKGGVKPDTIAALRTAPLHIPTLFRIVSSKGQKKKLLTLKPRDSLAQWVRVGTTHMSVQRKGRIRNRIPRVTDPLGRTLAKGTTRNRRGSLPVTHRDQPRASIPINVTEGTAGREPEFSKTDIRHFKCKLSCYSSCSFCAQALPKERVKSQVSRLLLQKSRIKVCEKCFMCHSIVLCLTCNKCQKCCPKSTCRGQTSKLLANLAGTGCWSESSSNPERGLCPPLSVLAKAHKVSRGHKLLCKSPQEQLPAGGIASASCSRNSPGNI